MNLPRARRRLWVVGALLAVLAALPTAAVAAPPDESGVVTRESSPVLAAFADESSGLAVIFGGEWTEVDGACHLMPGGTGQAQIIDAPGSGVHVVGRADVRAILITQDEFDALLDAVINSTPCPQIEPLGIGTVKTRNVVSTGMNNGAFTATFTAKGTLETDTGAVRLHARRSIVDGPDGTVRRDVSEIRISP